MDHSRQVHPEILQHRYWSTGGGLDPYLSTWYIYARYVTRSYACIPHVIVLFIQGMFHSAGTYCLSENCTEAPLPRIVRSTVQTIAKAGNHPENSLSSWWISIPRHARLERDGKLKVWIRAVTQTKLAEWCPGDTVVGVFSVVRSLLVWRLRRFV
jgi:hypothetical protein